MSRAAGGMWKPAALLMAVTGIAAVAVGSMETLPDDPHLEAFFQKDKCTSCHELDREGKPHEFDFVDSVTVLCHRCHPPMKLGVSHPIDIDLRNNRRFPKMKVPDELWVGRDHLLTCATCHDSHGAWKSTVPTWKKQDPIDPNEDPKHYKTYYLRIRDEKFSYSKLCDACHQLL